MESSSSTQDLSPRQKSKLPAHPQLSTSDITLSPQTLDQQIPLLISQYLHSHEYTHTASTFDSEVLGIYQDEERKLEYEEVERCINDGDFTSLENLLLVLLKGQRQKAFIYLCYRQQFLEHIENRMSFIHWSRVGLGAEGCF
jgi:COMPASS component SWD3